MENPQNTLKIVYLQLAEPKKLDEFLIPKNEDSNYNLYIISCLDRIDSTTKAIIEALDKHELNYKIEVVKYDSKSNNTQNELTKLIANEIALEILSIDKIIDLQEPSIISKSHLNDKYNNHKKNTISHNLNFLHKQKISYSNLQSYRNKSHLRHYRT